MKLIDKKLRVCHFPQIPCKPFIVEVTDEYQAAKIVKTLADQHLWLFKNNFIPDYSNIITVQMFEEGEWFDYYNEYEMMDWDDVENEIEKLYQQSYNYFKNE